MVSEALIGLVGVIVGSALTTLTDFVRSRATFQREKAWELFEEKRRHIEAIYEAVENHRDAYRRTLGQAIALHSGVNDKPDFPAVPWARLRMLVHLYGQDVLDEMSVVEQVGKEFGEILGQTFRKSPPEESRQLMGNLLEVFGKLTAAYDDLLFKLVLVATRLASAADQSTKQPVRLRTLFAGSLPPKTS